MTRELPVIPNDVDGVAALWAAEHTAMCKQKGERDTELVKRIVAAYLNGCHVMGCDPLRVHRHGDMSGSIWERVKAHLGERW